MVSDSADGTVRVRDVANRKQVPQTFVRHTDTVRCVAIIQDGTRVASGVGQPLVGHTGWVRNYP